MCNYASSTSQTCELKKCLRKYFIVILLRIQRKAQLILTPSFFVNIDLRWPSLWLPFLHFNSTEKCDAQCLLSTTRRHVRARTHTYTLQHAVNHTHYMKGGNSEQCPLDSKGSKLHPQSVCASFGHGWESLWVKQYTTNNIFRQEFNILDT